MIFLHKSISSVASCGHLHRRSEGQPGGDRSWGVSCKPQCENRILRDVEFASRQPDGVKQTLDEQTASAVAEREVNKDVASMARALSDLVKGQTQPAV